MGLLSSILQGLGIVADVYENTRSTETDVKSNKTSNRNYDFDDGTGYTEKDFLRERKMKAKGNNNKVSSKRTSKDVERDGR